MEPICLALSLSLSLSPPSLCLSGSIYGGAKSKERNRTKASVRQKRRSATAMAIRLVSLCSNCPNGQIDIHRSFRNLKIKECKSNRFLQQQLLEKVNFFVRQSGMDSMEILRSDQPCSTRADCPIRIQSQYPQSLPLPDWDSLLTPRRTSIVGTVRARLSGFSVWVLVRTRAFRVRAFRAFQADFYQL